MPPGPRSVLPPMDEVKEALHAFRNSYFQLGTLMPSSMPR